MSAHTCDRRSTKAAIGKRFPGFVFEKGFAEEDPFWTPLHTEPQGEQDRRSKAVLDDVVGDGSGGVVSVTSHSGEIASLLRGMLDTFTSHPLFSVTSKMDMYTDNISFEPPPPFPKHRLCYPRACEVNNAECSCSSYDYAAVYAAEDLCCTAGYSRF